MAQTNNANAQGDGTTRQDVMATAMETRDVKKTTPNETVFVCVRDCWLHKTRYRKGDELAGKACPPHFMAKTEAEGKRK